MIFSSFVSNISIKNDCWSNSFDVVVVFYEEIMASDSIKHFTSSNLNNGLVVNLLRFQ